jgi:hypothetical protein
MRMSRTVLRGALGEIPEVYSLQRCRSGTSVGEATRPSSTVFGVMIRIHARL